MSLSLIALVTRRMGPREGVEAWRSNGDVGEDVGVSANRGGSNEEDLNSGEFGDMGESGSFGTEREDSSGNEIGGRVFALRKLGRFVGRMKRSKLGVL